MKKSLFSFHILIMIIFICFSSCRPIEALTVSKVESVKFNDLSKNSVTLLVTMKVKNPNNRKFKITDKGLTLFVNKSELGSAKMKDEIVIKRKSEESYTFEIETEFSKLGLGAIPAIINMVKSKSVEINLKGHVRVKTMGIGKTYPIDIVERVGK